MAAILIKIKILNIKKISKFVKQMTINTALRITETNILGYTPNTCIPFIKRTIKEEKQRCFYKTARNDEEQRVRNGDNR